MDVEGVRAWASICSDDSVFPMNISGKSGCGVIVGIDGLAGVLIVGRETAKFVEIDAGTVEDSAIFSSKPSRG